jgi:hypothetical protein
VPRPNPQMLLVVARGLLVGRAWIPPGLPPKAGLHRHRVRSWGPAVKSWLNRQGRRPRQASSAVSAVAGSVKLGIARPRQGLPVRAGILLDRLTERAALGQLLEAARGGRSGTLVVHGEVGVGKTALLEDAIASAAGMRVARATGVESEMELAYAALQQLCAPMLEGLERLPDPQRKALDVVFGLRAGEAPDRFLVGLAALSLLADAAQKQPLLCVIDDAQWLDRASAQALGFVARRLLAEPVALVVAARKPGGEFGGLPELFVGGLGETEARDLLGTVICRPLDEQVRERFLAEARGNPRALLELPQGLTQADLAAGFDVTAAPGLLGRLEDSFRRRLEVLP